MNLVHYEDDKIKSLIQGAASALEAATKGMILATVEPYTTIAPNVKPVEVTLDTTQLRYEPLFVLKEYYEDITDYYDGNPFSKDVLSIREMLKSLEVGIKQLTKYVASIESGTPKHDAFALSIMPKSGFLIRKLNLVLIFEHVLHFHYTYTLDSLEVKMHIWGSLIDFNGTITTEEGAGAIMAALVNEHQRNKLKPTDAG